MFIRSLLSAAALLGGTVAPSPAPAVEARFSAGVTGDVQLTLQSSAAFAQVGSDAEPATTLTLGVPTDRGSITITFAGERLPGPGFYPIGTPRGVTASLHVGTAVRPEAVFAATVGWVKIARAETGLLEGQFAFEGDVLATKTASSARRIEVLGAFRATRGGTQLLAAGGR